MFLENLYARQYMESSILAKILFPLLWSNLQNKK